MCGDSAKVQLNNGVLQRRKSNWNAALAHFEKARQLEPGYCEPGYWIGVTEVNHGEGVGGISEGLGGWTAPGYCEPGYWIGVTEVNHGEGVGV